jgi:hypothetical protein
MSELCWNQTKNQSLKILIINILNDWHCGVGGIRIIRPKSHYILQSAS